MVNFVIIGIVRLVQSLINLYLLLFIFMIMICYIIFSADRVGRLQETILPVYQQTEALRLKQQSN